jgi:hypothetical protein
MEERENVISLLPLLPLLLLLLLGQMVVLARHFLHLRECISTDRALKKRSPPQTIYYSLAKRKTTT